MSQVVVKKIPIRILGSDGKERWVGEVWIFSDGRGEYHTNRRKQHIYLDCPCKQHGACGALCASTSVLTRAKQAGASSMVADYEDGSKYVMNIDRLLTEGVEKKDDFGQPERCLPIHEWVKPGETDLEKRIWKVYSTCIGKSKAEEFKRELEDKTGYVFEIQEAS